jgi:hypothetical protein
MNPESYLYEYDFTCSRVTPNVLPVLWLSLPWIKFVVSIQNCNFASFCRSVKLRVSQNCEGVLELGAEENIGT